MTLALCFGLAANLHAQSAGQAGPAAHSRVTDVSSAAQTMVSASQLQAKLRDRSHLERARVVEELDASPASDELATVALLRETLHDEDPAVAEASLRALLARDTEEHPLLTAADAAGPNGEIAEHVKVHFAARDHDTATLQALLRSSDAGVQQQAFEALAETDAKGAIELLRVELRDRDSLLKLQTLDLLARSPYSNAPEVLRPILLQAAKLKEPAVREHAAQMLKSSEACTSGAAACGRVDRDVAQHH